MCASLTTPTTPPFAGQSRSRSLQHLQVRWAGLHGSPRQRGEPVSGGGCRETSSAPLGGNILPARGGQRAKGLWEGGSKGAAHPEGTLLGAGNTRVNKKDRVGVGRQIWSEATAKVTSA